MLSVASAGHTAAVNLFDAHPSSFGMVDCLTDVFSPSSTLWWAVCRGSKAGLSKEVNRRPQERCAKKIKPGLLRAGQAIAHLRIGFIFFVCDAFLETS
jgi:hypothetical protein